MFGIHRGFLPNGYDGLPKDVSNHGIITFSRKDLKEWMIKYYPLENPAFLFNKVERTASLKHGDA
jgi:hypothetical protein